MSTIKFLRNQSLNDVVIESGNLFGLVNIYDNFIFPVMITGGTFI